MSEKILDRATLLARVAEARASGKRVALTNGVFDLLHVGHVRSIRAAARLADVLIVALNADASVRQLKGPGRPIVSERHRAEVIAALEGVTWVTLFDEVDVAPLLRAVRPDIHAKGADYRGQPMREPSCVEDWGGRFVLVGGGPDSTTAMIARAAASLAQDVNDAR
ncbi:MAG: adenylyltransferase/cytidyltransferase family protein [Alphaproteobacteria bacterium]|nr:adenylyltransferase/cytidyltransferase family protein [Alphaproteobacteria bacterium]